MENITITVHGSKGSGKSIITALIVNCLKYANFKNIALRAKNSDINALRRNVKQQKEFIHFFNEDDNKIIIREYRSSIDLASPSSQYPAYFNPCNIRFLLGYYDAAEQKIVSNYELLSDLRWHELHLIGFDVGCFFIVINDGIFVDLTPTTTDDPIHIEVKRGDFIVTNGSRWRHLPKLKTEPLNLKGVFKKLNEDEI